MTDNYSNKKKNTLCLPSAYSLFTSNWYSANKAPSKHFYYTAPVRGLLSFHLPSSNLFSLNYDVSDRLPLNASMYDEKSLKHATRYTHFTLKPLLTDQIFDMLIFYLLCLRGFLSY